MKETIVGKRLFWEVMSLFALFAVLFIVFQQVREREFKIEMLNLKLQDYNARMAESLQYIGRRDANTLDTYIRQHSIPGLRVTLTDRTGRVVYDSRRKDYAHFPNHLDRREIKDAMTNGTGYDISRESHTVEGYFFYSATWFADKGLVIRSALPYNNELTQILRADQHYLWFAVVVVAVLALILYRFIHRLGTVITKLRTFALRADRGESLDTEDLVEFPANELGEISEHIIKLYKRLQKTKEEQNELKRQLTQNIAHELKTPVASIQGYLETILSNHNIDEDMRRQFLSRCYAQSRRLASLLGDISILNRMDDGADMMEHEEVDVTQTVEQIERETALEMRRRDMTFVCRMPQMVIINGNQSMIYSIFRNLTDNAIAYAGDGTVVTLTAREETDRWLFTFSDNGTGVGCEHLTRLFERFYRVDKGRSRKMGGTGLGLAIVKNAVLLHGGTITASVNAGGGLRFDFSLSHGSFI